jgi:hypothetical protein
MPFYPGQKL